MDDHLSIDTPENIVLTPEVAGFGSRCVAAIVDYLLLLVVLIIATILFLQSVPLRERSETNILALIVLIQFLIITFYHLLFEIIWNGQTIGKRVVGIRVVQSNGLPLTVAGALIRNFVRLFDFLPFGYGVGLIAMFTTKQTQRLGDLAARTVVIREQRQLTLEAVKVNQRITYQYISNYVPVPHYIQIQHLTEQDRQLVMDFLRRRESIWDRVRLANALAQRMATKMGTDYVNADFGIRNRAEGFLEHIALAFELSQRD